MEKVIIGAGGFARELNAEYAKHNKNKKLKMFIDDEYFDKKLAPVNNIFPLSEFDPKKQLAIIAIADPNVKKEIVNKLPDYTGYWTYISPNADLIDVDNIYTGRGTIITSGCVLTTNIIIGEHVHLNLNTTVGHDSIIGDFCTTAPNVNISGNVELNDLVYIGTGAVLREKINIEENITIGMNSTVVKSLDVPNRTYFGSPAKMVLEKKDENLDESYLSKDSVICFTPTQESLNLYTLIAQVVPTFHLHNHILYDIIKSYDESKYVNYVEIGAYCGASSMLAQYSKKNVTAISIDLANPISEESFIEYQKIGENHLESLGHNPLEESIYHYIKGDSKDENVISKLKIYLENSENKGIDVLFIDGDHSYDGVLSDFLNYKDLVNIGGYIVFDDYLDELHSPDVYKLLSSTEFLNSIEEDFQIIGSLDNNCLAKPSDLSKSNCFVIRKIK